MPSLKSIARESLKVLGLVLVVLAIVYFFRRGGDLAISHPPQSELVDIRSATSAQLALCGPPRKDARAVSFEMVYSEDMRPWIELAADTFLHRCPNLQVKTQAVPDIEAADAILAGRLKPVLWAPTDEMTLRYLEHRQKQRGGTPLFQPAAGRSLVESPLVLLIWQDRLRLLSALLHEDKSDEGLWVRAPCALIPRDPDITGVPIEAMVPGTWSDWYAPFVTPLATPEPAAAPANRARRATTPPEPPAPPLRPIGDEPLPSLDEVKTWGRVKIAHARPTRDSAGSAALYLMAYDYFVPPKERQPPAPRPDDPTAPADDPRARDERTVQAFEKAMADRSTNFRKWLRRCEAGQDASPTTASELTTDLFDTGPSLYDGVVTYEHLALPFLDVIDSHADALRKLVILYPEPTLLARHPAVLFDASPEQKDAAQRWLNFLVSKEMQEKAIEAGFRPVNPDVTLRGHNVEKNQFLRLRRYGVLLQPKLIEAPRPDGKYIQDLITLWGEVTGRN